MVKTYWQIGKQIMEAQGGEVRAEYGTQLLKFLAERLMVEFGVSFDERNLRYMRQFYNVFPIWNALSSELSWTHYRRIMRIPNANERGRGSRYHG
ncbi:MAG: DUF1016 N-terminal domain-containing protein [Candidatus Bathyarchaeota archaeon]|nr:DUF1016 N-terminal domain-containing protein [Candidatus Termiticorpusculum sp.]